jgi:hypothetical protein
MDFHIVKMYKDKVSTKMSKIFVYQYVTVLTKLPNSEQSYKGKVKISQQPENCENRNDPD